MMACERQAVMTANSQSVDVNVASAAVAAARIEGERIATARAFQERQELQEQLQTAGLEAANTQVVTATIVDQNNQYREELKSHENARASLQ
eukprot:7488047-Pyramimonas_sp.AAC.1